MKYFHITLIVLLGVHAKKKDRNDGEDNDDSETAEPPVIDRLAMNLAGAFVKSLLPDVDSEDAKIKDVSRSDVRRLQPSPQQPMDTALHPDLRYHYPNLYTAALASHNFYHPEQLQVATQMPHWHPNVGLAYPIVATPYFPSHPFPEQPPIYHPNATNIPQNLHDYQPLTAGLWPNALSTFATGKGETGTLYEARNNKYYANLQKHQDLIKHGEQRKYQQALLDQRIGAALSLQKEQQELMKKRTNAMQKLMEEKRKQSFHTSSLSKGNPSLQLQKALFDDDTGYDKTDQQTGGHVLLTAKEKDVQKRFLARTYLDQEFSPADNYGVEIPEDHEELSDEERTTMTQLKDHLTQEQSAIKTNVFNTMMNYNDSMMTNAKFKEDKKICESCMAINITKLRGSWTQIYGNPEILNKTYSTIISLHLASKPSVMNLARRKANCIGLHIGEESDTSAPMKLFFRDDTTHHKLYEMSGYLRKFNKMLVFDLSDLKLNMCVLKKGPKGRDYYEYLALSETEGPYKCVAYHLLGRTRQQFHERYFVDIAEYMRNEIIHGAALPVARLPKAHLCEIRANR